MRVAIRIEKRLAYIKNLYAVLFLVRGMSENLKKPLKSGLSKWLRKLKSLRTFFANNKELFTY